MTCFAPHSYRIPFTLGRSELRDAGDLARFFKRHISSASHLSAVAPKSIAQGRFASCPTG
jgi:hypothetical protein